MNERIQELVLQANPASKKIYESDNWEYNCAAWCTQDVEKFAELIVRECIEVFSKDLPDPTSPDYQLGSLPEVVNRVCAVAEHFGVEE